MIKNIIEIFFIFLRVFSVFDEEIKKEEVIILEKKETVLKDQVIINKINLKQEIKFVDNLQKGVDEGLIYLKETSPSHVFIAGHSGSGPMALFNNISLLNNKDIIELIRNNKKQSYTVVKRHYIKKEKLVKFKALKEDSLYLITCSQIKKGYYLIIESILV